MNFNYLNIEELNTQHNKVMDILIFISKYFSDFETETSSEEIKEMKNFISDLMNHYNTLGNEMGVPYGSNAFITLNKNLDLFFTKEEHNHKIDKDFIEENTKSLLDLTIFHLASIELCLSTILKIQIINETECEHPIKSFVNKITKLFRSDR